MSLEVASSCFASRALYRRLRARMAAGRRSTYFCLAAAASPPEIPARARAGVSFFLVVPSEVIVKGPRGVLLLQSLANGRLASPPEQIFGAVYVSGSPGALMSYHTSSGPWMLALIPLNVWNDMRGFACPRPLPEL